MSSGTYFANIHTPQSVIQVGKPGDTGVVEVSDLIVSTQGAQAGAVLVTWNLASPSDSPSGMWDVHTRIGGFTGSQLQKAQCPASAGSTTIDHKCIAAYMSMHVTKSASGLYLENVWLWTADHDIEDPALRRCIINLTRRPTSLSPRTRHTTTLISAPAAPRGAPRNFPMAWGLRVSKSKNVLVYGAGLYSFFNDYTTGEFLSTFHSARSHGC